MKYRIVSELFYIVFPSFTVHNFICFFCCTLLSRLKPADISFVHPPDARRTEQPSRSGATEAGVLGCDYANRLMIILPAGCLSVSCNRRLSLQLTLPLCCQRTKSQARSSSEQKRVAFLFLSHYSFLLNVVLYVEHNLFRVEEV